MDLYIKRGAFVHGIISHLFTPIHILTKPNGFRQTLRFHPQICLYSLTICDSID